MKLKFMLLGIGIGLILSSSLFYFLQKNRGSELSDQEIMKRAASLGMVKPQELPDPSLDKLKQDILREEKIEKEEKTKKIEEIPEETKVGKEVPPSNNKEKKLETEADKAGQEGGELQTSREAETKNNKAGSEKNSDTEITVKGESKTETEVKSKTERLETGTSATGEKSESTLKADEANKKKTESLETKKEEKKQETPKTYTYTVITGSSAVRLCNDLQALGVIKDAREFNHYLAVNNYATRIRNGTFTFTSGESYHSMAEKLVSRQLNP